MTRTPGGEIQNAFDVAVVIPTTLRPSLLQAVRSVFAQDFSGRVQIMIGIDKRAGPTSILDDLLSECPDHMAITVCDPGYSTFAGNGGLYSSNGGGGLRTAMSHLANSPLLAYLDDDNWWAPDHLSSLREAIRGVGWAWSYRWLVDPADDRIIAIDQWDSVGPGRGAFGPLSGGIVDTNCLMIDKRRADDVLGLWSHGMLTRGQGEDRRVFLALVDREPWRCTGKATAFYRVDLTRHKALAFRMKTQPPESPAPFSNSLHAVIHALGYDAAAWEALDPVTPEPPPHNGISTLIRQIKPLALVDVCDGDPTTAFQLARAARRQNPKSLTVAVDDFLPRITLRCLSSIGKGGRPIEAYGESFRRFQGAVQHAGLSESLKPLPMDPLRTAELLREANVTLDLVRVPWRNDEVRLYELLRAFWPVLREGGVAFVAFYIPVLTRTIRGIRIFAEERGHRVRLLGADTERILYIVKSEQRSVRGGAT